MGLSSSVLRRIKDPRACSTSGERGPTELTLRRRTEISLSMRETVLWGHLRFFEASFHRLLLNGRKEGRKGKEERLVRKMAAMVNKEKVRSSCNECYIYIYLKISMFSTRSIVIIIMYHHLFSSQTNSTQFGKLKK